MNMTQDRDTLATKIRALLSKANSSQFEAEREAFMAKADQLMRDYQISMADVNTARDNDPLGLEAHEGGTSRAWKHPLGVQVAKYYGCQYVSHKGASKFTYTLVGRKSNRVTAKLMFEYLINTIMKASREQYKDERARNVSCESKGAMLAERLRELNSNKPLERTGAGIVPLDEASAYMCEHMKIRISRSRALSANESDRKWAQGVGLNVQAGGGAKKQLLLR